MEIVLTSDTYTHYTIMRTNIPSILLITAALYSLTGFILVFKISSQALAATPDKLDDTEL